MFTSKYLARDGETMLKKFIRMFPGRLHLCLEDGDSIFFRSVSTCLLNTDDCDLVELPKRVDNTLSYELCH